MPDSLLFIQPGTVVHK